MHNPFLKRFREFILAPSHARTISALVILIIAAAVPLTVLVAQQQQEVRQHAASSCWAPDQTHGCAGGVLCGSQCCTTCGGGATATPIATPAPTPTPTPAPGPTAPPPSSCAGFWCGGYCYSLTDCKQTYCCLNGAYTCSNSACATSTPTPCQTGTSSCGTAGTLCCPNADICSYNSASGYYCASATGQTPTPTPTPTPTATPIPTASPSPAPGTCTATAGNICTGATSCLTGFTSVTTATCSQVTTSTGPITPICCKVASNGALNPPTPAQASSFVQYCLAEACSTVPGSGECVVFTKFSWTPPSGTVPAYYELRYIQAGTTLTYGPYRTGAGLAGTTTTSITTPFIENTNNNGFGHVQCPASANPDQGDTGYSCGFGGNVSINWYVASVDSSGNVGQWSAMQAVQTASCPTQCTNGATQCSGGLLQTCTNGTWGTGTACPIAGQTCPNGATQCTCSGSTPNSCNGICTNTQTDINNCGSCGKVCGSGQVCTGGTCICQTAGQTNPYYTCSSNTCIVNNVCGANSGGCTSAGGVCGTPVCQALTANPPSVSVNGSSNVSISCTGTGSNTTYTWTSNTCGTFGTSINTVTSTSNTTWTAPAAGPTSCPVNVNVCNGTNCIPGTVTIPVTIPNCNAGLKTTSACVATTSNTCSANNGTQTAQYTTYNGSTMCNPVNITQSCSINSCNVGNTCTNGQCQPVCSGSTPNSCNGICTNTQTDINNCGSCGKVCASGQVCTNGACSATGGHTMLAFSIGMDAIGSAGDNENPNPSSSNQNPLHTTRNLAVQIFDSNNNQVFAQVGSINYNSGSGIFTGTVDLGTNFANGNYTVKVKSDGHLRRLIPGIQNLNSALTQPIQMQRVNLIAGDVDNNNILNINDYNILLSCVSSPVVANIDNHALCNTNANYIKLSDLEDNGAVDQFDYNLFLREYAVQNGD